MDVKEAVDRAKATVADLFATEGVINLGLEEMEYDEAREQWRITVGFSRGWDNQGTLSIALGNLKRTYKVVVIDKGGKALSVKNRETADAG
jgi:hypothetical protein